MKTINSLRNIPSGVIIHHPDFEEPLILGDEDFDEFSEYEGRWVSGVNNTPESGIGFIMSFEDIAKAFSF